MKDAIKGYLALAGSLTEVTRQKALAAARTFAAQGEATAGQVTSLADDLVAQSRSNREAVTALVKYEVDRALGRVGLASSDDVAEITRRLRTVEATVRDLNLANSRLAATPPLPKPGAAGSSEAKAPARPAARPTGKGATAKAAGIAAKPASPTVSRPGTSTPAAKPRGPSPRPSLARKAAVASPARKAAVTPPPRKAAVASPARKAPRA